jgi:hypothetical protein
MHLPSEVRKGIGKNHSRYEVAITIHYYYHVTPSNTDEGIANGARYLCTPKAR